MSVYDQDLEPPSDDEIPPDAYVQECNWCGSVFTDPRPEIPYCSANCERLDNEGDPRWRR